MEDRNAVIPLVDLGLQHAEIADEVRLGWQEILDSCGFIGGAPVVRFEDAYAQFCELEHCIGVGNGTDALEVALRAVGVGPGDECVLPVNTFIATADAVWRCGARPVLVDCVDDGTYLMDTTAVDAVVSDRTRAVIPVHLYGQMAAVERLRGLVARGVAIVEDAAQAHGALRSGAGPGVPGQVAATSFYPGKNLGAYGDAGAVLTNSHEIAVRMRMMREYGSREKYSHHMPGFNSRLDPLQAVVLSAKLVRLSKWNAARQEAAARYDEMLADLDTVIRPSTLAGNEHVWHLYVVQVPDRDSVLASLNAAGIGAAIHYPQPIHLTKAFEWLGYREGSFPVAERISRRLLTLPLFPGITDIQQEQVVDELSKALRARP